MPHTATQFLSKTFLYENEIIVLLYYHHYSYLLPDSDLGQNDRIIDLINCQLIYLKTLHLQYPKFPSCTYSLSHPCQQNNIFEPEMSCWDFSESLSVNEMGFLNNYYHLNAFLVRQCDVDWQGTLLLNDQIAVTTMVWALNLWKEYSPAPLNGLL